MAYKYIEPFTLAISKRSRLSNQYQAYRGGIKDHTGMGSIF